MIVVRFPPHDRSVEFYTTGLTIPYEMLPVLHFFAYDSDMIVVRFPEHYASIDDPNFDLFFRNPMTGGKYVHNTHHIVHCL